MFSRRMKSRLRIGRFLGIDLFIHWTFWLLFFGAAIYTFVVSGSFAAAGYQMAQIAAVFVCVTLHEYGHAMMARRFDVQTVDITLLPIGGLARLERMPRIPYQELLVAVAGPAVNVVIAALVAIGLGIAVWTGQIVLADPTSVKALMETLVANPAGWLLLMNVILVVFNMIPAFPMDGGRVLRSVLAMFLDYRFATRTAARIGLIAAVGLGLLGLNQGELVLVLISVFIGYAGWAEARQVEISEAIRGVRIEEATIRNVATVPADTVPADTTLRTLAELISQRAEPIIPVIGVNDFFLGMLELESIARAVRGGRWDATAADIMTTNISRLPPQGLLDQHVSGQEVLEFAYLPVVDSMGRLIGLFDTRALAARVTISRHLRPEVVDHPFAAEPPIMARLIQPAPPGTLRDSYL